MAKINPRPEDIIRGIPVAISILPRYLDAAGVPVPKVFQDALDRAKWGPKGADVGPAIAALKAAKTREEYDAAVDLYIEADHRNRVISEQGTNFENTLTSLRQQAAADGFVKGRPEMVASLLEVYGPAAEAFATAYEGVPSLAGVSPFDIPAEVAQKLADAKAAATKLNAVYDAWHAVHYGEIFNPDRNTSDPNDTVRLALMIGDFGADLTAAQDAGQMIHGYNTTREGTYGPIAPWCAVFMAGGRLVLRTPAEADDYSEDLATPTLMEISEQVFHGYPVGRPEYDN